MRKFRAGPAIARGVGIAMLPAACSIGGGEMADQVKANPLMDISDVAKDEIASVVGSVAGWQVNGKTYGLPWSLGVVGFWCNKAFFTQAGIAPTLVTIDNTRWTTAMRGDARGRSGVVRPAEWDSSAPWPPPLRSGAPS